MNLRNQRKYRNGILIVATLRRQGNFCPFCTVPDFQAPDHDPMRLNRIMTSYLGLSIISGQRLRVCREAELSGHALSHGTDAS
jgi:hypothetical protein